MSVPAEAVKQMVIDRIADVKSDALSGRKHSASVPVPKDAVSLVVLLNRQNLEGLTDKDSIEFSLDVSYDAVHWHSTHPGHPMTEHLSWSLPCGERLDKDGTRVLTEYAARNLRFVGSPARKVRLTTTAPQAVSLDWIIDAVSITDKP